MTQGVLYYNRGVKCLTRLAVSIVSLRKFYQGAITLAAEGDLPTWITDVLEKNQVAVLPLPTSPDGCLVVKSGLWRVSPFDLTIFLDSDTVIQRPIQPLFDTAEKHQVVVTQYHDWVTSGRIISGRVKAWLTVARTESERALAKPFPAVNTGVMAWARGAVLMPVYEAMTRRGMGIRGVGRKTLDEIAMQLVLPDHPHKVVGSEWNMGCVYDDCRKAAIVHYHGYKHCRASDNGNIWRSAYFDTVLKFPAIAKPNGDECVDKWMTTDFRPREDMTIVTAVSPKYADCARRNIALWRQTPGLKEQQLLIFVAGFKTPEDRKFLEGPNTKIVRWDYPFPDATERERMLASFIFGTAKHVKTPFWMKLDSDCKPIAGRFEWPEYRRQDIVSHGWGYTKMKGDDGAKKHWFNRLDEVFSPGKPMFPKLHPEKDRYVSHRPGNPHNMVRRFASFCHIERTEFTRSMAEACTEKCKGRLPIPSQDTTAWYCAVLWNMRIKLMDMRLWFNP